MYCLLSWIKLASLGKSKNVYTLFLLVSSADNLCKQFVSEPGTVRYSGEVSGTFSRGGGGGGVWLALTKKQTTTMFPSVQRA